MIATYESWGPKTNNKYTTNLRMFQAYVNICFNGEVCASTLIHRLHHFVSHVYKMKKCIYRTIKDKIKNIVAIITTKLGWTIDRYQYIKLLQAIGRLSGKNDPARKHATPMDAMTFRALVAKELKRDIMVARGITLMWINGARFADIAEIQWEHILAVKESDAFYIRWSDKSAKIRGERHVTMMSPAQDLREWLQWGKDNDLKGPLFTETQKKAIEAAIRATPSMTLHSIKRGALQVLGTKYDVTWTDLMSLAHHKKQETTVIYMDLIMNPILQSTERTSAILMQEAAPGLSD
jgi:integrase